MQKSSIGGLKPPQVSIRDPPSSSSLVYLLANGFDEVGSLSNFPIKGLKPGLLYIKPMAPGTGKVPFNQWIASLSTADFRAYNDARVARGKARITRSGKTSTKARKPRQPRRPRQTRYVVPYSNTPYLAPQMPSYGPMAISPGPGMALTPPGYAAPAAPQYVERPLTFSQKLGGMIGEGVEALAKVVGFGEYATVNSCLGMIDMGTSPPTVRNTSKGEATIIHHREYIGDLYSGFNANGGTTGISAFTLQSYNINIGNSQLFPFGYVLGQNFQEWEARGMLVELKTLSSDYASSLSLGSMFCAVDYNSLDNPPTTKQQLENFEYAMSSKPSQSIIMPIECARRNDVLTHLYTAYNSQYNGGDPRLYDIGDLYIGTQGIPTCNTPIAEIWITYEIALYKPKISIAALTAPWQINYALSGITGNNMFANAFSEGTIIPDLMINPNGSFNTIQFPPVLGNWFCYWSCMGDTAPAGGTGTVELPNISAFNCSLINAWGIESGTGATGSYVPTIGVPGGNQQCSIAWAVNISSVVASQPAFIRFPTTGVFPADVLHASGPYGNLVLIFVEGNIDPWLAP